MTECCTTNDSKASKLYVISFTVLKEAGLALVAAKNEKQAFQILQNSGSRNCHDGNHYTLIQIREIGMIAQCHYGLLMESFVNALEAYDAIINAANKIRGPKGEDGKDGVDGKDGKDGATGSVTREAVIDALGYVPASEDDKNVQGDWSQNNPDSGDYIKNRTHWTDANGDVHKLDSGYLNIDSSPTSGSGNPISSDAIYNIIEDIHGDLDGVEYVSNKETSITNVSTDTRYASAKAVYLACNIPVATSAPSGGMLPNVAYYLGTLSVNTTFALASPVDNDIANLYIWQFTTGSSAPSITWPSSIEIWNMGSAPEIKPNTTYEITVLNGYASVLTTNPA